MTLKNNRAPLLSIVKLYASFHHHMWIQTGVTVRKRLSWVVTSATLTYDLWPWPLAWTSLLSLVITPENFMMIWWLEHSQKGVTDGRTDWTIHRAAWSQLKMFQTKSFIYPRITTTITMTKITKVLVWMCHFLNVYYIIHTAKKKKHPKVFSLKVAWFSYQNYDMFYILLISRWLKW